MPTHDSYLSLEYFNKADQANLHFPESIYQYDITFYQNGITLDFQDKGILSWKMLQLVLEPQKSEVI